MADFNILQSSILAELESDNFLTNAISWELVSTKNISAKIKEINNIQQTINNHFDLKTRP